MDGSEATDAACGMAKADSLRAPAPPARVILRYTTSQPQILPRTRPEPLQSRSCRAFAVGSCYARTASYPIGVYWWRCFLLGWAAMLRACEGSGVERIVRWAGKLPVRARSFRTEVPQDESAWIGPQPQNPARRLC